MTELEIIILIVGAVFVVFSFFMGGDEKLAKEDGRTEEAFFRVQAEAQETEIKRRVQEILEQQSLEVLSETKEKLSKLSNDKIIAMDEFSSQVLAKIQSNNDEVIFLYDMFQKKEEEMKSAISKLEQVKRENRMLLERLEGVKEMPETFADSKALAGSKTFASSKPFVDSQAFAGSKSFVDSQAFAGSKSFADSQASAGSKPFADSQAFAGSKPFADSQASAGSKPFADSQAFAGSKPFADSQASVSLKTSADSQASAGFKTSADSQALAGFKTAADSQAFAASKNYAASKMEAGFVSLTQMHHTQANVLEQERKKADFVKAAEETAPEEARRREQILKLYHANKSIREISKQLSIGQGEVQLVIDLYGK